MLITGNDGKVLLGDTALADITFWQFQTTVRGITYASSATGGFRKRIVGARAGQGRFAFRFDAAAPLTASLGEGSSVTLKLHLDGSRHYTVPAIIESLQCLVRINPTEPIQGEAAFVTNGAWQTS